MSLLNQLALSKVLTPEFLLSLIRAVVYVVVGIIVLRVLVFIARRVAKGRVTDQASMLISKSIMYSGMAFLLAIVLLELGVNLTPLLGAAGIVGIVVGIASQASLSNVISGLFLISEKPFSVGDVISSGNKTGIVLSIDLLSVKIRTFDNLYIRIPNQAIATTELTNITRFPIRRLDFNVGVAYKEDLEKVRQVLLDIAKKNPYCLDEPAPLFVFNSFGNSSIDILLGVWFSKTDYLLVKNSVFLDIKRRFDEEGIEIPFPHQTIYTGEVTKPFPIRVVDDGRFGTPEGEHSGDAVH